MNIAELRELLDYHYWARDRTLAAVAQLTPEQYERDMGNSFRSVRDTVNHLFMAEWVWYTRWTGGAPTAFPTDIPLADVVAVRARWSEYELNVRAFLESLGEAGMQRELSYKLMSGAAATSTYREMFVHVINHATYHRGQITTMLRQLAAKPPESLDLITFFRERAKKS